jgi:rhodanese-related sulfurtransferase
MKKISNLLVIAVLAFAGFTIFIKNKAEADAKSSYAVVQSGQAVLLDVREEAEVKDGMIKGALWYPLSKIEANTTEELVRLKELTKGKEVYVYCRSGGRAGKVKTYLEKVGVKSLNLGGYSSLVSEQLPTQSPVSP